MKTTIIIAAFALIGFHGQALPDIGTSAYSAGCVIQHAWEDGTAIAYCPEDGATYVYDADGNNPPASVGYEGPRWESGWYPCSDQTCAEVDYTQNVEAS